MGTRADFYVGKGSDAEWIGSIAWDGYRESIPKSVSESTEESSFRAAVFDFLKQRDDASFPSDGWPWPWDSSEKSDCSYWFFDGKVWMDFSGCYVPIATEIHQIFYPDMSNYNKRPPFGAHSGIILVGP